MNLTPFKKLYSDMVDIILADTGLTTQCSLIYDTTKLEQCPNCLYDTISKKSANKYKIGGPIVFTNGQTCPYCLGKGITSSSMEEEMIYLALLYDSKNFIGVVNDPNIVAQTICSINYLDKLKKCSKIIFNTDIKTLSNNIFARYNEPQPVGLGDNRYLFTNWARL
jgi:hypothetical protein